MPFHSKFLIPLCAAGVLTSLFSAQTARPDQKPKLTPRELFYSASPPDTPHKGQKGQKGKTPTGGGSKKGQGDSTPSGGTALPGGGQIVKASASPIGVTYTLQKLVGDAMVDVSPKTVFHKDDHIAFVVQANCPGYLYIGNQGPDGAWTPLFPSAKIENGNNHIDGFHKYTMPPGYRFYFDEKTGVETVFILFSREPVPDFDKLLYDDPKGPGAGPQKPLKVATAEIPKSAVDRLRTTYSRDLLIEKIDEEKAVYAVAPSSADSQLWYEFQLVHK